MKREAHDKALKQKGLSNVKKVNIFVTIIETILSSADSRAREDVICSKSTVICHDVMLFMHSFCYVYDFSITKKTFF